MPFSLFKSFVQLQEHTIKLIDRDFSFVKYTFAITEIIPKVYQLDLCSCVCTCTYKPI